MRHQCRMLDEAFHAAKAFGEREEAAVFSRKRLVPARSAFNTIVSSGSSASDSVQRFIGA